MTTSESNETPTTEPSTPTGDVWDVSALPPEPEQGSAVVDRDGKAWIRRDPTGATSIPRQRWTNGSRVVNWPILVLDHGPLTRLVPATSTTEPERSPFGERESELLRINDDLRATLARYRGTPALYDAALSVVRTTAAQGRDVLNDRMARLRLAVDQQQLGRDLRAETEAQGVDVDQEYRDATRDLIGALSAGGPGLRWVRKYVDSQGPGYRATLADAVNAVRMDLAAYKTAPGAKRRLRRNRVIAAAQALIRDYDSERPHGRAVADLRDAVQRFAELEN